MPEAAPTPPPVVDDDDELTGPLTLDLDALEREDAPSPFVVRLGGKTWSLVDPDQMSIEDLLTLGASVGSILNCALPAADREEFGKLFVTLPQWKANRIAAEYRKHFGLPSVGEAGASPES